MFYATMPTGRHEVVGLNDHEGLWSKKEEFWGNKQNDDFLGKCFKRDFLSLFNKGIFREKGFKETSYKDGFMGKSSKSLLSFFSIKVLEISNKVLFKQ